MEVEVTERVCERSVLTGAILLPLDDGISAGRIVIEKSAPEDNSTREEGKNLSDVTLLRCGFEVIFELVVLIDWDLSGDDMDVERGGAVGYR